MNIIDPAPALSPQAAGTRRERRPIRARQLPFFATPLPAGMHDMLVLNQRPDLIETDASDRRRELAFQSLDFP